MTGDQILADRKNDKDFRWEKKVLAVKQVAIDKGFSPNSAKVWVTAARSFFGYHRLPLQFRRTEKAHLGEGRAQREDYRFSLSDLQKMYDVADLGEKYVLIVGKSFGLRAGDFIRLTRGDLEAYIDREPPISIGAITTAKESVKAYPFIDTDAQPTIRLMLEKMSRQGMTKPTDRMLSYSEEIQLTRVLKRLVVKAGLNVGNKTVRFHCLRKFLCDHLASHMSESKWKQVVGKKISEGAYISPDELRKDYARAMEETTFGKQIGSQDMEKIAKKQALLMLAKSMGMEEDQVTSLFRKRFSKIEREPTIDDEIEILESSIKVIRDEEPKKPKSKREEACEDGEHCAEFSQIPEAQLITHLKDGWEIVKELSNGEFIVKRVR